MLNLALFLIFFSKPQTNVTQQLDYFLLLNDKCWTETIYGGFFISVGNVPTFLWRSAN